MACSQLPRDPEDTLKKVAGNRLRVGLVERPPWVIRTTGEPSGAEVELIRQFAAELGATPAWNWGSEQQHIEAMEHFQLDLVAGGFTAKSPWNKNVGLTSPYFEDRTLVGVPSSLTPPQDIEGMQVAAKKGELALAYLKKKKATPVEVDELSQTDGAVAAPDWELERLGLTPTKIELYKEQHVLAVPPGENGWLKRLEEFLGSQRSQIKNLLHQQEAQR